MDAAPIGQLTQATLAIADTLALLPVFELSKVLGRGLQFVPFIEAERLPEFQLQPVLHSIVEHVCSVVRAAVGVLIICSDQDEGVWPLVYSGPSHREPSTREHVPGLMRALASIGADERAIRIADIGRHPVLGALPSPTEPFHSLLSVGIYYQRQKIGQLLLFDKTGDGGFAIEDEQAAELLAAHAGIAIQQAVLRASIEGQRAQLHVILESVRDGVVFVERDSGCIIANAAANTMFGRELVPAAGEAQLLGSVCHPDGRPLQGDEMPSALALRGEPTQSQELMIRKPDGDRLPVQVQSAPVHAGTGTLGGVVVVYQDISQTKELERLRQEYISLTSHDLRAPLSVILMHAQLVQRLLEAPAIDQAKIAASLASIQRNGQFMNALIQDMLDVTRLEAGIMEIHAQPTDLVALVSACIDQGVAPDQRRRISIKRQEEVPAVMADQEKIARVVINLLTNAVKYATPDTPIDVRIGCDHGQAVVSVTDHGKGIEPGELDRLFEKFYRSQKDRKSEGLGLGLYISRLIIGAHQGNVWATSQIGRGSTFSFSLPLSV